MTSYSDNEDQDIDEFEDANEALPDVPLPQDMTLSRAVNEAQLAIDYYFNNQFDEARNLMIPYSHSSIYHALGHSVFYFLEAMLTWEPQKIVDASKSLKVSMQVCNKYRKKRTLSESIGKMVRQENYELISEEEAHAELCHAECLLLRAMLTFMEDETLGSFIKAGIKIRSCYNSYKDCQQILSKKKWGKTETKEHFEGGVKLGIGAFNLMISMLPSKIIKLLEFIGFSGNKELGLEDLQKGYEMEGIRQILCLLTLLAYNLTVLYILSHTEGDLDMCEKIIARQIEIYPSGAWFLYFKGRLEFMKGNLDTCRQWYIKSWKSQDMWPQFHHLCFWELLWVECTRADWSSALQYSKLLLKDSKWSRTIYSYQTASIMLMQGDLSETDLEYINKLMKDVPKYKQRIAGKSIPIEKFAVKKAERYLSQNQKLVLPMIELMYIWNFFKVLKTFNAASTILKVIDKEEANLKKLNGKTKYKHDNMALVNLLKGGCLKQLNKPTLALDCLEKVIAAQKDLYEDNYLVPYAIVELALIEWKLGNREKAILALEDAKKNFTGYSLESRLHFRIHTALCEYKQEYKNGLAA